MTTIDKIRCALSALMLTTEQVNEIRVVYAWLKKYGNDKVSASEQVEINEQVLEEVRQKLENCLEHIGNYMSGCDMVSDFTNKVINPLYDCVYGRFEDK